jgi:hypothetical protein
MAKRLSNKAKFNFKRARFEKLEPRILLSGDLPLDGLDQLDTGPDEIVMPEVPQEEHLASEQLVDNSSGEIYQPEADLLLGVDVEEVANPIVLSPPNLIEASLSAGSAFSAVTAQSEREKDTTSDLSPDNNAPSDPTETHLDANPLNTDQLIIDHDDSLTGSGIVQGLVINEGVVAPGNSPGVQTVDAYTQTSDGVLLIEIGGLTAGGTDLDPSDGYDQLNVTSHSQLGGALDLRLINDFDPVVGNRFDILTFNTLSDGFDSFQGLYIGEGKYFQPELTANGISLVVQELGFVSELTDAGTSEEDVAAGLAAVDQLMSYVDLTLQVADQTADTVDQIDAILADLNDTLNNLYQLATDAEFSGSVDFNGQIELEGQYFSADFSLSASIDTSNLSNNIYQLAAANLEGKVSAEGIALSVSEGQGSLRLTSDGIAAVLSADVSLIGLDDIEASFTEASLLFNSTSSALSFNDLTAEADQSFRIEGNAELSIADTIDVSGNLVVEKVAAVGEQGERFVLGATDLTLNALDAAADQLGVSITDVELVMLLAEDAEGEAGYAVYAAGDAALAGLGAASSLLDSTTGQSKTLELKANTLGQAVQQELMVAGQTLALNYGLDEISANPAFDVENATLELDGIGSFSGDFRFELAVEGTDTDDNALADLFTNQMMVSGNNITANISAGDADVALSEGEFALLLENQYDSLINSFTVPAWAAAATGTLTVTGVPGLNAQGSGSITLNQMDRAVDQAIQLANGSSLNLTIAENETLKLAANVTAAIDGFAEDISGQISLVQDTVTSTIDNAETELERLILSGEDAGLNVTAVPGVSFDVTGTDFLLAQLTNTANSNEVWQAVKLADAGVSLSGLTDVALSGTGFALSMANDAEGKALNWAEQQISHAFTDAENQIENLALDFSGEQLAASGDLALSLAGMAEAAGQIDIQRLSDQALTLADGSSQVDGEDLLADLLSFSAAEAELFLGVDAGEASEMGVKLTSGFNAVLGASEQIQSTSAENAAFYALQAATETVEFSGPSELELAMQEGEQLILAVNQSNLDSDQVIDFAASELESVVGLALTDQSFSTQGSMDFSVEGLEMAADYRIQVSTDSEANPQLLLELNNASTTVDAGVAALNISNGLGLIVANQSGVAVRVSADAELIGLDEVELAVENATLAYNTLDSAISQALTKTGNREQDKELRKRP